MIIKTTHIFLLIMAVGMIAVTGIALAASDLSQSEQIFLPQIMKILPPPTLQDAWVTDQIGIRSDTFAPGESVEYHIQGENPSDVSIQVDFKWSQVADCGESQVHEETLTLPPGRWSYHFLGNTLGCLGTSENTVTISDGDNTSTITTNTKVLDSSSQIVVSQSHGFEKCGLPSIEQMATWKQESPYDVFNIYLGGEHFACNLLIDADWVREIAEQGWDFILTWAGHGTSCWEAGRSNYHPISSNPSKAYQEGRLAAEEAIAAARSLGFLGQKIIYYDVEGYSDVDDTCRPAMVAFLEGWAARLHESGDKAGAYGSPCRSYMMDWADNDPHLDDIWFARWSYDSYDQAATVDDSESTYCPLPDDVWPGKRRIRQYAGDHAETWGTCNGDDCTINSITSNVMYGEITELLLGE
jgi:hypothetical protein